MLKKLEIVELEAVTGGSIVVNSAPKADPYDFIKDAILSPWEVVADGVHDMFVNPKTKEDCEKMKSDNNQQLCENRFDQKDKQADNGKMIWIKGEHDLNYNTAGRLTP